MKENQRLKKLLKDHFNGEPWIDVVILTSLAGLKAKDAVKNIHGLNSIWQIVNHMSCWRETLLRRVEGERIPSPADNYFFEITDPSAAAWNAAIKRLKASQKDLLAFLSKEMADPDNISAHSNYSQYELLQAVLQHDAYHLGQIVLIRKMLGV